MNLDKGRLIAQGLLERRVRVASESMRSTIYDLLERYRVGSGIQWPGNRNPSSSPGDPPARQSGDLMESVRYFYDLGKLRSVVGPFVKGATIDNPVSIPYANDLEYGAPLRRIAPRPFMRRALAEFKVKWRSQQ
jgi:hypothetical protein